MFAGEGIPDQIHRMTHAFQRALQAVDHAVLFVTPFVGWIDENDRARLRGWQRAFELRVAVAFYDPYVALPSESAREGRVLGRVLLAKHQAVRRLEQPRGDRAGSGVVAERTPVLGRNGSQIELNLRRRRAIALRPQTSDAGFEFLTGEAFVAKVVDAWTGVGVDVADG